MYRESAILTDFPECDKARNVAVVVQFGEIWRREPRPSLSG
jgi:hypothetical protein